jgi:hypothetical protein
MPSTIDQRFQGPGNFTSNALEKILAVDQWLPVFADYISRVTRVLTSHESRTPPEWQKNTREEALKFDKFDYS